MIVGPDTPEHWRFYGRAEELKRLGRQLAPKRGFHPKRIQGRRGIGKTELLVEVGRRANGQPPVLIFDLKPATAEDPHTRVSRLVEAARTHLPADKHTAWPPPDHRHYDSPCERFVDLVAALLDCGIAVGLDEFHLARPLGLDATFKIMIDARQRVGSPPTPGRLFVLGSHQQQLLEMFASDQPLHQRITAGIALKAWRVPTVLEMACEQGLLSFPGRFLTLWTAFGGIPRAWEDFIADEDETRLPDMTRWSSDQVWRAAFISHQEALLERSSDERFDDKATIELSNPQRAILMHLGQRKPRGDIYDRVRAALGETIEGEGMNRRAFEAGLHLLIRHLDLIEVLAPFDGDGTPRLQLVDNPTLFQLHVFPELWSGYERVKSVHSPNLSTRRMARLETLEGQALERLTEGALKAIRPDDWILRNAWNQCPNGREVDLLAIAEDTTRSRAQVTIASCKRNANRHLRGAEALDDTSVAFLAQARAGRRDLGLPERPDETLLVSPEFTPEAREQMIARGRRTLDIRGMARLCGIPLPAPHSA